MTDTQALRRWLKAAQDTLPEHRALRTEVSKRRWAEAVTSGTTEQAIHPDALPGALKALAAVLELCDRQDDACLPRGLPSQLDVKQVRDAIHDALS